MASRFDTIEIRKITIKNYRDLLPLSLASQIECFIPPEGSFDTKCLHRYLEIIKGHEQEEENFELTLANRLRMAYKDLKPDSICSKFPRAELPLKRRLRCVAEYLIRAGEFDKLKDENGKLVKKTGNLGKLVVIYKPLPKLLESLVKQGLLQK